MRLSPDSRLLFLLGLATFFEGYGRSLVAIALPYVQQSFDVSASELSYMLGVIGSGSLGALLLGMFTDRIGRRRVLLAGIVLYSILGAGTALAMTISALVAWQLGARIFQEGTLSAAIVIAAEEMPAGRRGKAQGVVGTVNACGSGFAALLFGGIALVPGGWRGLAVLSLTPLAIVPFLRRELRESRRWTAVGGSRRIAIPPEYRSRLALIFALSFLAMSYDVAGFAFTSHLPMTRYGWSPAAVSAMIVVAGGLGLPGFMIGGELADRIGRRFSAAAFLVGLTAAELAFYCGGERALWVAFAAMVFCQAGKTTVIRSWMTELFPTSIRGTATAWVVAGGTVGGIVGFLTAGWLTTRTGDVATALSILSASGIAGAALATFGLPETSGLELEVVAPEALAGAVVSEHAQSRS
jgi:MFS family permease